MKFLSHTITIHVLNSHIQLCVCTPKMNQQNNYARGFFALNYLQVG